MVNSLAEITNRMETFCDNSPVVNEFNADDFSKFTSSDHEYPLLWATPLSFVLVPGRGSYGIQVALMDKIPEDDTNPMKTLSDLSLTLSELMAYLDDDSGTCNYYAVLNPTFQPFYRGVDDVTGWQGTITFNTSWQVSRGSIRTI